MRTPWIVAALMLALGVAYVIDAVAFRTADDRLRLGPLVEGPVEIDVVRTWGELMARPAVATPGGARLRFGIEREDVPARNGTLVYVAVEAGPGSETFRHHELGVSWSADDDPVVVELAAQAVLPEPVGSIDTHRLFVYWVFDAGPFMRNVAVHSVGRRPVVYARTGVTRAPADDAPWISVRAPDAEWSEAALESTTADAVFRIGGIGPWAVPAPGTFHPVDAVPADAAARGRRLPALIPDAPDPGVRLEAAGRDLALTLAEPADLSWPQDHLMIRYRVNGAPPPVPDPGPEAIQRGGPRLDGTRLRLLLDYEALGARPGDELTIEALWCPDGWTNTMGIERLMEAHDRPLGPMRSNALTIRVP